MKWAEFEVGRVVHKTFRTVNVGSENNHALSELANGSGLQIICFKTVSAINKNVS